MFRFFFAFCLCYAWRTLTHCADVHTHVSVCMHTYEERLCLGWGGTEEETVLFCSLEM